MSNEKKPAFTNKTVVLGIGTTDFKFTPSVQDHNNYVNSVALNDKAAPMHQYLSRTVDPSQKDELLELLNTVPGLTSDVFGEVVSAAKGEIKVTLKN